MTKRIDITGHKYGRLTALSFADNRKWLCRCDCGKEKTVSYDNLVAGRTKSCGCLADENRRGRFDNIEGRRYGRLLVLERAEAQYGLTTWLCRCDCGNETVVTACNLKKGHTKSCGCYRRDLPTKHGEASGHRKTKEYVAWTHAKARCHNPKHPYYQWYGARGISMCPEWREDYSKFLADMGPRPEGCSLDRVNNDGNYEPGNCRWVSMKEQSRNKRSNIVITFEGQEMIASDWEKKFGVRKDYISKRLRNGMNMKDIVIEILKTSGG